MFFSVYVNYYESSSPIVCFLFQARHIYICEYHKGVIQSIRNKRKRKESDDDNGLNDQDMDIPEVSYTFLKN